MFPLTRQSFVSPMAVLLIALSGWSGNTTVFAQNGDDSTAPPAASTWSPPPWYMDPVEADKFTREKISITQLLKLNSPSSAQIKEIQRIAHYYLSRMTHEEIRERLPKEVTQRLHAEILTPSNRPNARAALLDELIRQAPALLTHPSDLVRINTVLMLSELSIEPANFQSQTPAIPYAPAHKVLVDVLKDPQQLLECRIIAARGLGRICRDDENNTLSSTDRSDIGIALVETVQSVQPASNDDVWWFRFRLIEALGYVDRLENVGGEPIMIDTLLETLANPKEHLLVRSQAALSLSRLPYNSSTNVQLITHEICQLILRLSAEFEKNPSAQHWRDSYSRVYLAFRPASQRQANRGWGLLYQVQRGGLGGNSSYVNAAFERAMPIFKSILEPETPGPIPKARLTTFQEWVAGNQPSSRQVTSSSKPLAP